MIEDQAQCYYFWVFDSELESLSIVNFDISNGEDYYFRLSAL